MHVYGMCFSALLITITFTLVLFPFLCSLISLLSYFGEIKPNKDDLFVSQLKAGEESVGCTNDITGTDPAGTVFSSRRSHEI